MERETFGFFTETLDEDITAYLDWLADNGLTYHFDDSPESINWGNDTTIDQYRTIVEAHERLHDAVDIWEWFETPAGEEAWAKYMGEEPCSS